MKDKSGVLFLPAYLQRSQQQPLALQPIKQQASMGKM